MESSFELQVQFSPWPKISRLFRDVIITEKIDGTNAAIGVERYPAGRFANYTTPQNVCIVQGNETDEAGSPECEYVVYAQSRSRIITPSDDNFGFARWVYENAAELAGFLGQGIHFGEWWGSGIQRGYGLPKGEKRFSLFNTVRWEYVDFPIPGLGVVPVLHEGLFDTNAVLVQVELLRLNGSVAAPGFMDPEGVVTFHKHSRTSFKTTLNKDEMSKGEAGT